MAKTNIPWGDPKAVTRYSAVLHKDIATMSYFGTRFSGTDENNIVHQQTALEKDAGDTISFDLCVELRGDVTYGDNTLDGKEEALRFFTDTVSIDQLRKSVSAGGRASRKKTNHDLRKISSNKLSQFWKSWVDQFIFITLAGARGINEDYLTPLSFNGFAQNSLLAPSTSHHLFAGAATSVATITTADVMNRALIERAVTHTTMLPAVDAQAVQIQPLTVEGENRYVIVMSPFQSHQMRNSGVAGDWFDIQKAIAAAVGNKNRIMKGGLGMINNTVLHDHSNVIRFNNAGAGGNLPSARALLMGRQAVAMAYGSTKGNQRMIWEEVSKDYGNSPNVAAGYIFGAKKTRFDGRDFGVMALDSYAPNPNPI